MNLLLRAVPCLLLISALATSATTARAVSPELQAAFGWLDSAGIPSAKGLQPVEAWTGGYCHTGSVTTAITLPAFLISDLEKSIQVQTMWGERLTFDKRGDATSPGRTRVEPRSLDWLIKTHVEGLPFQTRFALFDGLVPSDLLQWVMLARHCRDCKEDELLQKAKAEIALKMRHWQGAPSPRQQMADDTAEYLFKRALWMFGTPTRSWTVIHQSLEHVGKMMPETGLSDKATLLASRLTSLMNEEQARPTLSHEAILKLPLEQQVIEQVRRLRMANVETSSGSATTVNELIKMGAVAVPALIAAVDDPRPTRVFHCPYGRAGQCILSISSIGELASQALVGISGKTFKGRSVAGVFEPPTPDTSELRQEIEAWWVEYQKRSSP